MVKRGLITASGSPIGVSCVRLKHVMGRAEIGMGHGDGVDGCMVSWVFSNGNSMDDVQSRATRVTALH